MHLEPDYGTGSALRRSRTDNQATTVPMTNAEAAHNPATAYSPRDTDRLPKWQAIAAQTLASNVATINTNPTDDSSGLNPSGEQLPTRAPEAVTARLERAEPLFVDAVPLTLEEIFIYELGGEGREVRDIVL